MDVLLPEYVDVPVPGGTLKVARWAGEGPVVVAAHGITANALAWARVAAVLGGAVTLVAPDLRGRGESGSLPAPYGMAAHADDLVAVLDHLGVERAPLIGHSMGGFVVTNTAVRHGDRVSGLVLVDGGVALQVPEGTDIDAVLQAVIGPAMQRLSMTFESREAYRQFWQEHPALAGSWNEVADAYTQRDLVGREPELHSSCSLEAVRADATDTLLNETAKNAVHVVDCPAVLVWAERGLLDEPQGLYDEDRIASTGLDRDRVPTERVDDVNHYTILLTDRGAEAIARHVLAAAGATPR